MARALVTRLNAMGWIALVLAGCKSADRPRADARDAAPDVPANPDTAPDPDRPKDPAAGEEISRCCPLGMPTCGCFEIGGLRPPSGKCPCPWDVAPAPDNVWKEIDKDGCLVWRYGPKSCLDKLDPPAESAPEPGPDKVEAGPETAPDKPCPAGCTPGVVRCTPTGHAETCIVDGATGCGVWGPPDPCTGPPCTPFCDCECKAAPPECAGLASLPATVCAGEFERVVCDQDKCGCVFSSEPVACPYRHVCRGPATAKVCACAPAPGDADLDPKTRYVTGTGCTATERDSKDPKVNSGCDPKSGLVVRCKALGLPASTCNVWVAQPACLPGQSCTTDGTKADGSPVSAPHCG